MIIYQNATDHARRNSELCTFSIENMWLSYEEIIEECAAGKYKQKHYHGCVGQFIHKNVIMDL